MPRNYRHIKEYEKEILDLKRKGYTKKKSEKSLDLQKNKSIISYHDTILTNENLKQE